MQDIVINIQQQFKFTFRLDFSQAHWFSDTNTEERLLYNLVNIITVRGYLLTAIRT